MSDDPQLTISVPADWDDEDIERLRGAFRRDVTVTKWLPPEADDAPWRLDVPSIPARVTCVKDWIGDIWLRDPDDPDRWNGWSLAVGPLPARLNRRWLNTTALTQRLPLIEYPDPRKATST